VGHTVAIAILTTFTDIPGEARIDHDRFRGAELWTLLSACQVLLAAREGLGWDSQGRGEDRLIPVRCPCEQKICTLWVRL
jgi:hypothetical protein